ncbi:MAG TPA: type II toxin-antitoxin system VapC family toxin [Solirubrobacterales bacterium]|nr:type II toxin-antitoxin system VapC family toxin [Solirubrobacterales bacterium]
MAVLIDTSVLIHAERRGQSLDEAIGDQDRAVSVITASELLHGVHRARTSAIRARRAAFVEHLLSAMEPLPITTAVARAHAEIWAELENDGSSIGAHDLWIAATALNQGMPVATANTRDFSRIPGLDVVPI